MKIVTKRIYESAGAEDGLRVLVDRLWPRGVRRESAQIDHWAKDLAPSPTLRKWFAHDPARFDAFAHRYREELAELHAAANELLAAAGEHQQLTLLYAAKDAEHNHAVVLRDWLEDFSAER